MPPTWAPVPAGHPFGPQTLPYGVFTVRDGEPARVGVALGEHVLDLTGASADCWPSHAALFAAGSLDPLLAAGRTVWRRVRAQLQAWLADDLEDAVAGRLVPHLLPAAGLSLRMPFTVADYVDFYASRPHATNLGRILRPGGDPLPANWQHLPIGYHGRSGTVVVSGSPVYRPYGQRRHADGEVTAGPCERLDFEAELGFVVGAPSPRGTPVPRSAFREHVFGAVLVNDWSARDIQAWESVPLGPFLGKSFATSVGAWVVPLEALECAWIAPPARTVRPVPYLDDTGAEPGGLDVRLEVRLNGQLISRPAFAAMYWTPAQQLAHLTVNGASLRTGDLFASGTVSGPAREQWGSLIELSHGGRDPVRLPDGSTRAFLADGDQVVITATAPGPGGSVVGFGEVRGSIVAGRAGP